MSAQDVASKLFAQLSSYPWFVSIGIGAAEAARGLDTGVAIYLYVKTLRHKELDELKDGYEGYPIVVEKTGPIKPATWKTTC